MWPLQGAVWGLEEIREWLVVKLTEKLAHEDPDRISAPKMSIAGPALLNLHFCKDEEELREMYATLLASSMAENRADEVHPSFVYIIQQLSADEACILQWIAEEFFPLKEADDGNRVRELSVSFSEICKQAEVLKPGNIRSYQDNLLRLNLIWAAPNLDNKHIEVTALGKRFLNTCVAKPRAKDT